MQEIMQYTTYGIALIGGLAFLVAIIVQVLKELPKLKKIPTSVVALVVSLILCPVTLIALCTWYANTKRKINETNRPYLEKRSNFYTHVLSK